MKICLVEKENLIRSTLQDFLSDLRHDVIVFNELSGLLDALDTHHPSVDLILIDLSPNDREAIALMREVHESRPDIPFIVMKASGVFLPVEEAVLCGVDAYLHKPISLAELELALIRMADAAARKTLRDPKEWGDDVTLNKKLSVVNKETDYNQHKENVP